jgi:anti-sigma factor RsiW
MMRCNATPVSWLRLERYCLGELDAHERGTIEEHLAACAACAACAEAIARDGRAGPKLSGALASGAEGGRYAPRRARGAPRGRVAARVLSTLAIAAALFLIVRERRVPDDGGVRDDVSVPAARIKGGSVALSLVRDDAVHLVANGVYRDGDRVKALVTCPPGTVADWDLVVYERGEASFPLERVHGFACGNEVPMPGAFALNGGEPLTVCVAWAEEGSVDREALRRNGPPSDHAGACVTLRPAEAP